MEKTYTLFFSPEPLSRPRVNFTTKSVYDSQRNLKSGLASLIASQHGKLPFFEGPLELDITFVFDYPANWSRAKKDSTKIHSIKPDLDNLVKMICDVCQDVLYKDDSRISKINAIKIYDDGKGTRTEFTLREI